MEKYEVGRFYATSFNDNFIEFVVFNDHTMNCPTLNLDSFYKIELKPRFVLRGRDLHYTYDVKAGEKNTNSRELISHYDIDEELFDYLKQNGMIKYSTDMAYFYGFKDKNGYDSVPKHYGVGSPYKWAKKKGPILVKQRSGQFH